jgi:FtsH Extracellular
MQQILTNSFFCQLCEKIFGYFPDLRTGKEFRGEKLLIFQPRARSIVGIPFAPIKTKAIDGPSWKMKQRQFSIWYFLITLVMLMAMQYFFLSSQVERIPYSQFKSLVKNGLVTDLIIEQGAIRGNIKAEGMKQVFSAEKLKQIGYDGKGTHPFTTIRVEDPGLIAELERGGNSFPRRSNQQLAADYLILGRTRSAVFPCLELSHEANGRGRCRPHANRQKQGKGLYREKDRRYVCRC